MSPSSFINELQSCKIQVLVLIEPVGIILDCPKVDSQSVHISVVSGSGQSGGVVIRVEMGNR